MSNYYSPYGNYYPPQQTSAIPSYQQPVGLSGRIVNSEQDITFADIPNNGSIAMFPKADYSEIYLRQMNNLGQVVTLTFKPVQQQQTAQVDLQDIANRINKLEKTVYKQRKERSNEQSNEG